MISLLSSINSSHLLIYVLTGSSKLSYLSTLGTIKKIEAYLPKDKLLFF